MRAMCKTKIIVSAHNHLISVKKKGFFYQKRPKDIAGRKKMPYLCIVKSNKDNTSIGLGKR